MRLPSNPYIAGPPLRNEEGFFGRQQILHDVAQELCNPHINALVLFGQRRIGKTSLLLQLERILRTEALLPIYFDLQNQATHPLGQVLANLAQKVANRTDFNPPADDVFDNQGHFFRSTFLPQLYEALGAERRPVFLLDEFDIVSDAAEAELPATVAAKALFPFLSNLMIEEERPAFVFVVGRRTEDLGRDFIATFKGSESKEVWVIDRESAEALVRQAEANGTLRFTDDAVARILNLTNGHPYLTQLLCQRIWERAHSGTQIERPQISISEVESAVPNALEAGEVGLTWLWDGLSPAEKIYTAALAEAGDEGAIIPETQVIQVLTSYASRLRTREVELAPLPLVKRRVLEVSGEREYRFAVDLFRRWIRKNKPLHDVKDEIDDVEPVAKRLFEAGQEYFHQHKWEDSIRHFREALEINSRHFRARLLLGEALMELGQTDEAMLELDQAYELDPQETRLSFIRALVARARVRWKAKDAEGALADCEQVLQIFPDEQRAKSIMVSIWIWRGDVALERDDLDQAFDDYQRAGAVQKIEEVEKRKRRKLQKGLENEAQIYEESKQWIKAQKIYQQLLDGTKDEELRHQWQRALERVEAELLGIKTVTWHPDQVLDNKYKIIQQLAITDRCEIYQVVDLQFSQPAVVIKRLKPDKLNNEDARRRFEREVDVLGRIRHPSVLSIYESKVERDNRYFVTEFADRGSLKEYLERASNHRLNPNEALGIAKSICEGLDAAHGLGFIHRDVKPGNILLFQRDDRIVAKLADFSIARDPHESLTQTGWVPCTPPYASPEQLRAEVVDARSDIYSWGIVFFEMLTGEKPLESLKNPTTFFPTIDEFPSSFFAKRGIPSQLITVLQKALHKDREFRYQSAADVLVDLRLIEPPSVADIRQRVSIGETFMRASQWQEAHNEFDLGLALCKWYGELPDLPAQILELADRLKTNDQCALGMKALGERKWQAAIEILEPLQALDFHGLGIDIAVHLGLAQSEQQLERQYLRVRELQRQEDWAEIIRLTADLINNYSDRLDSDFVNNIRKLALYARGRNFLQSNAFESAYDQFHRLYRIDPGYEDVAYQCANVAFKNATQEDFPVIWEHRVTWLEKAIQIDPNHGNGRTQKQLDIARHRMAEELLRDE